MRRAEISSRSTLHTSKLAEFTAFCASKGWAQEPCKGAYEVLRMRHPLVKEPLLVYRTDKAKREHYTTYGQSSQMLAAYLRGGEARSRTHQTRSQEDAQGEQRLQDARAVSGGDSSPPWV